jgi:hypothetical protein
VGEWNDVLDDAASEDLVVLEALAQEGLKKARKTHDYRSEVLFASLVDFYRWMPHQGRLRAAARVAQNLGRGAAFERVLRAQARFFETNGDLFPSRRGQKKHHTSLLDDEALQMGVQRWLRTLEAGKVSDHCIW